MDNKFKVALVGIAKAEENYLKEWVDYHLKIGFDEIFIYQNDWTYPKQDITDERVHFGSISGLGMQTKCYNDFIMKYKDVFDFAAFIDIDEFLWLRDTTDVHEFLKDYFSDEAMFVNWRLFGDNGLAEVKDGNYSVIKRFTRCSNDLNPLGKNIINLRLTQGNVLFHNPHILITKNGAHRTKDPTRQKVAVCVEPYTITIFQNHVNCTTIETRRSKSW